MTRSGDSAAYERVIATPPSSEATANFSKPARTTTVSMTLVSASIEKSKESRSERPAPGQSNQTRRLLAASGGKICEKNDSQSSLT